MCALVVAFLWLFDLAWDFIFGSEEEILGSAFGLGSGPRSVRENQTLARVNYGKIGQVPTEVYQIFTKAEGVPFW